MPSLNTAVRFSTYISVGGKRVELPPPNVAATRAWRRANCVFCPLGPAPTRAWLVMTRQSLLDLDKESAQTITWSQSLTTQDDGSQLATKTLTFPGLYVVRAERMFHGGQGDANALYLVEFADGRYLSSLKSDSGALIMNMRSYASSATYLTGTQDKTWTDLVQSLWEACPKLGTWPGLPGSLPIDGAPDGAWQVGINAYRSLCAVLDQLDCAICHDPLAGTYSIVQLGATQTVPDEGSSLKWDAQPLTINVSQSAATLRVYFHQRLLAYGQERDTELSNNWAYSGAGAYVESSTGIIGAHGVLQLWDDLPILIDETGQQSNSSAQTTRVNNRKSRYVTRMSVANQHRVHFGLLDTIKPGAQVRATLWRAWGDDGHPLGGTCTEFTCCPQLITGFKDEDGVPNVSWTDRQAAQPQDEPYSTPDLARHTFPNYPRLPNVVQVWHDGSNTGDQVDPDQTTNQGVKVHSGRVKRWVNGSMSTMDPCWVMFVDDFDNLGGNVRAVHGEYYGPARLSGIASISASTLPVYVVKAGAKTQPGTVVQFRLTSTLSLNVASTASAVVISATAGVYAAAVPAQTITVIDGLSQGYGRWSGIAGAQGLAVLRADGLYEIVDMERNALIVEFTAYSTRPDGSPSFLVTVNNQYQQGDLITTSNPLTVWDDDSLFPHVVTGAKGRAVWNDKANRYEVLDVQQVCLLARANIYEQGGMNGDVGYVGLDTSSFTPITPSPFNLKPSPTPQHAINIYGLRGCDNDEVLVARDEDYDDWIIIQCKLREVGAIVTPDQDIEKGSSGVCTIVHPDALAGTTLTCKAEGDKVYGGKKCSTWTDPTTGTTYVAPWEP